MRTAATDRASSLLTFFSGRWEGDAEQRIRKAVDAAERLLVHSNDYPVPPFGARWVCVADQVHDRTVFLAHRIGASHVLRGESVDELTQKICSFALAE
jgi:hypothetical protein